MTRSWNGSGSVARARVGCVSPLKQSLLHPPVTTLQPGRMIDAALR
jgi:hypothetical protein